MGVTHSNSKTIGEYQRSYRRSLVRTIAISQAIVALSFGGGLLFVDILSIDDPIFWLLICTVFLLGLGILLGALNIITYPLDNLLAALAHKTGELTTLTPPNPNAKNNESSGLKTAIEAVYQSEAPAEPTPEAKKNQLIANSLNHTSCGVVLINSSSEIIAANSSAPLGYDRDSRPFLALDFIDDQDISSWLAECQEKSIRGEKRWQRVGTNPQITKNQRFFDIVASYEKGAPAEVVVILIDQSNRYLPEEEDLNFVAFAAHELRGPIAIIRGYLDVLEQELADRLKDDEPELLSRLTVSANRLSSYISNILNVIKFDRHHLQVHLYEDSVPAIYSSIADDMQLRAKSQHRLLNVNFPENLPTVAADRASISEVIGNLIDNAIKYSFEGGIIDLSAEAKGDFVEISVKDNGIGIPGNVVKNVFRKFYRSHRSRDAVAGSGIGLYICKALVESHGGSISVRSRENEGSTFTFSLPIYATIADKLLEDGQLNKSLIRHGGGWIKNHAMYRK